MAKVSVKDLQVRYGSFVAVQEVNLTVADGEFCVFLGPSGCGKTSTLRAIAGLETPTRGQIIIGDEVVNGLYPGERDIGMVFQSYALYPHLTVAQHFAFPLKAQKMSASAIQQEMKRIADLLDLGDMLERRPRDLSIGQAQRVAIGRALIRKPRLLLLDEPLNNLDMQLSLRTRAVLKRLQRDLGITTIYVTHDQEEAQSVADTIVVMRDGHIQQSGGPLEIYDQPVNEFVAGFIGTPPMNFMRCRFDRPGSRLVGSDGFALALENADSAKNLSDGAEVTLGIRPERLHLEVNPNGGTPTGGTPTGGTPAGGIPTGSVHTIEPEGNDVVVSVKLGEAIWKIRTDRDRLRQGVQRDTQVGVRLEQDKMLLFDSGSGARV